MSELTHDERDWLLSLLENIQLTGNAQQMRELLSMIDSIKKKLSKDKTK